MSNITIRTGMLIATGKFVETSQVQRLLYNDTHPIDILPFGSISNDGVNIEWPPDHSIQVSVAGFREAFESSVKVILRRDPLLEIKVASLPSLTALKLVAWKNRGITNNKDAKDIGTYKLPGVASVCLNAKNWNFK